MTTLRTHAVLDHDADTVWKLVRDAGNVADWFPAMTGSSIEGSLRRVTLADGSVIEEVIVASDDSLRRLQYRARAGDLPIADHLGTVDVIELDPGRSILIYSTDIAPAELARAFDGAISEAVGALNEFLSRRG
ncbi:SRPBCC family protein [Amycolatopsis sp. K13G38]|uniref:SRPBCC family protein n=1 Tax=Amycolatopsis acididurans TaxID=2724524 RepID=A0ABX1JFZ8_9PSEU|nr:SRPBCC family protein [Amycolatopsis acididurans]NKQ57680.1 SRPBCC family protein [Amycolatopsis acididurans]